MSFTNLPEWDPSTSFKKGEAFTFCMGCPRRSGKSYLFRHLFKSVFQHQFDLFVVFSETLESKTGEEFYNLFPHKNAVLFNRFKPEKLEALKRLQTTFMNRTGTMLNVLVVIDDCSSSLKDSKPLEDIFARGRHKQTSVIWLSQRPTMFSSTVRGNCEFVGIFKATDPQSAEFTQKSLVGSNLPDSFGTKKADKIRALMNIPKHNLMVLDSTIDEPVSMKTGEKTRLFRFQAP